MDFDWEIIGRVGAEGALVQCVQVERGRQCRKRHMIDLLEVKPFKELVAELIPNVGNVADQVLFA